MQALICELCGSNDIVKIDNYFVCQHCGTKYSVEEARKMIGIVKIDKTEEAEKLLILARRAREENNCENAEKYYDKILQDDPNNWEAAFFQVYYKASQCNIKNIQSAATSVSNCISGVIKLISEGADDKKEALSTVVQYSVEISNAFATAANSFCKQTASGDGVAILDCVNRLIAITKIFIELESAIKNYCNDSQEELLKVQKEYVQFLSTKYENAYSFEFRNAPFCRDVYKSAVSFIETETKRLTSEIQNKELSYVKPEIKKSGCYIATAVYGSYDCPEVWTLRRYRDYSLAETWYGRVLINSYYAISPTLVKWFGNTTWFKKIWRPMLDRLVIRLNGRGIKGTPYHDRTW